MSKTDQSSSSGVKQGFEVKRVVNKCAASMDSFLAAYKGAITHTGQMGRAVVEGRSEDAKAELEGAIQGFQASLEEYRKVGPNLEAVLQISRAIQTELIAEQNQILS